MGSSSAGRVKGSSAGMVAAPSVMVKRHGETSSKTSRKTEDGRTDVCKLSVLEIVCYNSGEILGNYVFDLFTLMMLMVKSLIPCL